MWQYIMMKVVLSLHISPPHFFPFSLKQCTGVHFIWVHNIWSSQLCKRLHALSPWLSFTAGLPCVVWLRFTNFCAEISWMFQADWILCKVNIKQTIRKNCVRNILCCNIPHRRHETIKLGGPLPFMMYCRNLSEYNKEKIRCLITSLYEEIL